MEGYLVAKSRSPFSPFALSVSLGQGLRFVLIVLYCFGLTGAHSIRAYIKIKMP